MNGAALVKTEELFFNKILNHVLLATGLDCREYNESYIKRRINARIMAYDLVANDFYSYLRILQKDVEETRKLFNALTINVTKFFRDINLWAFLKKEVIPKIISEKEKAKNKTVHIWSCGCSSGEEPYSIAMLFNALTKDTGLKYKIIASDIDEPSLEKAKIGIYDPYTLTNVPKDYLLKYFRKINNSNTGGKMYEFDASLKSYVTFIRHNFFREEPPGNSFDMIFCRNVIIYFTPQSKDKLVSLFHSVLSEHGWLIIGESEILFTKHMKYRFYMSNEQERVYRRERRKLSIGIDEERRHTWWYGYKDDSVNKEEIDDKDTDL